MLSPSMLNHAIGAGHLLTFFIGQNCTAQIGDGLKPTFSVMHMVHGLEPSR